MILFKSSAARLRSRVQIQLEQYSRPSTDFFVLIMLSSAITVLGLELNNSAVVIGAMVVAPLITPVFGFSLAILILRVKSMAYSLISILSGSLLAVLSSFIFSWLIILINGEISINSALISGAEPNLLFFLVAILSGMAGAYAYARPKMTAALPGIAIAVTIIPPLAIVGLGMSVNAWSVSYSGILMFLFNLFGIMCGNIVVFIATGFGREENKIEL